MLDAAQIHGKKRDVLLAFTVQMNAIVRLLGKLLKSCRLFYVVCEFWFGFAALPMQK